MGTGLKQARPLHQGASGGGNPILFTCAGLFSRCSGDVCPVGATICSFIHSFNKDIVTPCVDQRDQVQSRTMSLPSGLGPYEQLEITDIIQALNN